MYAGHISDQEYITGKDKMVGKDDEKFKVVDGVRHVRNEPRPDFSKPPEHHPLPKDLQKIIDAADQDSLYEEIWSGT